MPSQIVALALIRPTTIPRASTKMIATHIIDVLPLVMPDNNTLARLTIDPIERSMPPVITTRVCPRLTIASAVDCSKMLVAFERVLKRSETMMPNKARITISPITVIKPPLRLVR